MDHFDPLTLHSKHSLPPAFLPPLGGPSTTPHASSSSDGHLSQAQAASMRRKKNANAQAAFRARRANYIASLEETVTSLEAVVLSLQDTCREARNDADDLRQQNEKLLHVVDVLKQANREREKEWREFWHEKQHTLGLDVTANELAPPRTTASAAAAAASVDLHASLEDDHLRFHHNASSEYAGMPAGTAAGKDSSSHDSRYQHQPFTTNPEGTWIPGPFSNTRTPCVGETAGTGTHPSQSSSASDSPPSLSPSGTGYGNSRFPVSGGSGGGGGDEAGNRMSLVNLNMPYGRGVESEGLYTLGDVGLGHGEYGTGEGYHSGARPRRAYSGPQGREDVYDGVEVRTRRPTSAAAALAGPSSSSSSAATSAATTTTTTGREREGPMSNTLAVIKAQAFGSLRRTRTRAKKASDSASKIAIEILAARGIGMGVQSPRKRKSSEDDEGEGSLA